MKVLWTSKMLQMNYCVPGDLCRALSLNSTTFYALSVSFLRNIHKAPPPSALSSSSSSSLFFIFLIFLKPLHFPLLWPAVSGNTSRSQLYHYAGCDPCVSDREEAGVFKLRPSSEFLRTRVGVLVKPISEACEVLYPCVSRAMLTVKGLMDVKGHVQKKSKSVIFNWHQAKKKGGGTFCSPRQKRCRSTLK